VSTFPMLNRITDNIDLCQVPNNNTAKGHGPNAILCTNIAKFFILVLIDRVLLTRKPDVLGGVVVYQNTLPSTRSNH
jgi:hypothetical protein